MKYILKNKEIELTDEEVKEITKQSQKEDIKRFEIKNKYTGDVIYYSTKTTYKDVLEEAVSNGANLSGANLYEVNLSEANLSGADLFGANLSGANLHRADLSGANLSEANLYEANLSGADLYEVNLYEANLYEANLAGADLSGAELQNAKFHGKGGTAKIKRNQLDDFLKALGIIIKD
jgi:hypothetical protein